MCLLEDLEDGRFPNPVEDLEDAGRANKINRDSSTSNKVVKNIKKESQRQK
jgi:hypothetical protein